MSKLISPIPYKAKINLTINKLPQPSQALFHAALIKHSFNVEQLLSDKTDSLGTTNPTATANPNTNINTNINNGSHNKNKSRNENESRFKKYFHNKDTAKTFSKESEMFKNLYNKIKRNNRLNYDSQRREIEEYNDKDKLKESDCSPIDNKNIFLPSIILERPENINTTLKILSEDESKKEIDLVEKYSHVMMNMKMNYTKQQPHIQPYEEKYPIEVPKAKKSSKELYKENRRLIKEICRSDKTFKSLSELPEYCITTVNTKELLENTKANSNAKMKDIRQTSVTPLLTEGSKQHQSEKIINQTKPKTYNKAKVTAKKQVLSNLYDRLLINQVSKEHSKIIKYFKGKNNKLEPVNLSNGSNLHGMLQDFQKKTAKVNIPEKTVLLINKFGLNGTNTKPIDRIAEIDKQIQVLNYDYMTDLLLN